MAVDSPTPLVSVADMRLGGFADLTKNFLDPDLLRFCIEASRACETEVDRRFMPFTLTESHRASGVDPEELGGLGSGIPLDLSAALGASYSAALGGSQNFVRKVWLRETAVKYPDMWAYSNVSVAVTVSIGGTNAVYPMAGPYADSGLLWFRLGAFIPPGSLIQVTYSGGYTTYPADLTRAAKYMTAAICCRELDPEQSSTGHDAGNLEELAVGWLSAYGRL